MVISGLNACREGIEDNFFAITIIESEVSKIVEMKREEEQKKIFFFFVYIYVNIYMQKKKNEE